MKARTFNEVVSDWEHGLEPYKGESFLPGKHLTETDRTSRGATTSAAEMIRRFFSLKVSSTFLLKVIAAAVFWFFFAILPPLNTGEENGFYTHNFFTDKVEYVETGIAER